MMHNSVTSEHVKTTGVVFFVFFCFDLFHVYAEIKSNEQKYRVVLDFLLNYKFGHLIRVGQIQILNLLHL